MLKCPAVSFPGRLLDTSAGRVFVHVHGASDDLPPLVLIHGMFVSHFYFRPVIDELRRRFRVICVDLPGFGESDRPPPARFRYDPHAHASVVAEVLDQLDVPRALVIGHSMGGGVALALAARHPDRVARLVVANAWVYPIEMPLAGRAVLRPLVGDFIWKNVYGRRDLKNHFRNVFRDPALATEELVDYYWERFNRAGARDAGLAALRAFAALPDNTSDPGRVRCPTLVVWGEEDKMFPLAHGKRLERQIPGARLFVVPACGHSPHEERPDEFLRGVLPFLLDTAAADTAASPSDPPLAATGG